MTEKSIIEKSKKLAEKLNSASKRNTKAIITKAVESQTEYEKRRYKRNYHIENIDLKIVENTTFFFNHMTNKEEIATTNNLVNEIILFVVETKKDSFMTSDIKEYSKTHGSSYGDVIIHAVDKLKAVHALRKINIAKKDSNKKLYKYFVVKNSEIFNSVFNNDTKIS